MKVFLDTNILLDVLLSREPFAAVSGELWTLAEQRKITGFISAISVTNIYYLISKFKNRQVAQKAVRLLLAVFTVVACDEKILTQAADGGSRDYEDGVQIYSALRCGALCLISRDATHFPKTALPILSPQNFLAANEMN